MESAGCWLGRLSNLTCSMGNNNRKDNMKHLIVLMLVLVTVSVSAESLYYWDGDWEQEWDTATAPFHGVKFEFADFPDWVGMTIHELEIGFWSEEPEDLVMIFIFDGDSLPDSPLDLGVLADSALCAFPISPYNGMNIYELPGPVDVGQVDGIFWVLIYTENSLPSMGGENQLAIDEDIPQESHTYRSDDTPGYWNGLYGTPADYEAHVTVNGYPWTMSLDPATWGSLKSSF